MLVTQNTIIGYTIINGTVCIQLCLLIGSTYSLIVFNGTGIESSYPKIYAKLHATRLRLPILHLIIMVFNFISTSSRFTYNGVK